MSDPHLLVLEDDPVISYVLGAVLRYGGMSSQVVSSPDDALEALEAAPFAAILIDIGLGKPEALQVVGSIRARHELPIIVIGADGAAQHAAKTLDAGADAFLLKPFLPNELLAHVRNVLRTAGR